MESQGLYRGYMGFEVDKGLYKGYKESTRN